MTFHDKRLKGLRAKRRSSYRIMLDGAASINLWPDLRLPKTGSLEDDWRQVGEDIRRAMREEA